MIERLKLVHPSRVVLYVCGTYGGMLSIGALGRLKGTEAFAKVTCVQYAAGIGSRGEVDSELGEGCGSIISGALFESGSSGTS